MDNSHPPATGLRISNDAMYRLLREGCIKEFNVKRASGEKVDLTRCDLRGLDLRGLEVDGLDFTDCYFRQTDLRGIDFRKANLQGASINAAKISGARFAVLAHDLGSAAPVPSPASIAARRRMASAVLNIAKVTSPRARRARMRSTCASAICSANA